MDDPALEPPILSPNLHSCQSLSILSELTRTLPARIKRLSSHGLEPVDAQQATNPAFDEKPYGTYLSTNSRSVISTSTLPFGIGMIKESATVFPIKARAIGEL